MTAIEHLNEQEASDPELALMELDVQEQMQFEARERIELLRAQRKVQRLADKADDEDDDHEVDIEYRQ